MEERKETQSRVESRVESGVRCHGPVYSDAHSLNFCLTSLRFSTLRIHVSSASSSSTKSDDESKVRIDSNVDDGCRKLSVEKKRNHFCEQTFLFSLVFETQRDRSQSLF
jgi:hypothetical protein